jgi:siroheme synthase-like protein
MRGAYYPVMLDLRERTVLFVGGGWETEHKVRGLLEAGARVTLVSAHDHPGLEELALEGRIHWERRAFRTGDLEGVWLVMSHPVDKRDNAPVWAQAQARGVLCNCVDDPQRCSFILPSVLRRGDLTVSVSTSGVAPALGVRLKQRFSEQVGAEYGALLELLRAMRPGITTGFSNFDTRKHLWYALVDSDALELLRLGDGDTARGQLEGLVKAQREACRTTPCPSCPERACPALEGMNE